MTSKNIYITYMKSPVDYIEIQANDERIEYINFVQEKRYKERLNAILQETIKQLEEYFQGTRKHFDLPLEISGTPFQKQVWKELTKIPYGKTLSYGEIAKKIDNPKASRAVGNANNKNKISIVIPCHRVIGSKGNLVGFGGGLWIKKWLLEHEEKHMSLK